MPWYDCGFWIGSRTERDEILRRMRNHPLFEELEDLIAALMAEYGPDGHTDGCDVIAAYILDKYKVERR